MAKTGEGRAGSSSYQVQIVSQAERTIRESLQALSLPLRGFYSSGQVCSILRICSHTFCRLIDRFEPGDNCQPIHPNCLRALQLGLSHRVSFLELVEFVKRNDDFQRSATKNPQNTGYIVENKELSERIAIYKAKNVLHAERCIKVALLVMQMPIRNSYTPSEVCLILGISEGSFWRLVKSFELDGKSEMVRSDCLLTICPGHPRVPFLELVEFVRRNDKYLRNISQGDPQTGEQE